MRCQKRPYVGLKPSQCSNEATVGGYCDEHLTPGQKAAKVSSMRIPTIRERQADILSRYTTLFDSGILSPTTKSLMEDAVCLLAEGLDDYENRELHHFEVEEENAELKARIEKLEAETITILRAERDQSRALKEHYKGRMREAEARIEKALDEVKDWPDDPFGRKREYIIRALKGES